MKGNLKRNKSNEYDLLIEKDGELVLIATTSDLESSTSKINQLSKKNCDDLFNSYNFALSEFNRSQNNESSDTSVFKAARAGYIEGFMKSIEFNKDKRFTKEDMLDFGLKCINGIDCFNDIDDIFDKIYGNDEMFIEVEIETEGHIIYDIIGNPEVTGSLTDIIGNYTKRINPNPETPRLDEDGFLILKRI